MSNDTQTQTLALTDFLLARIAEDEARVRGITSGADPDFFWGPDRIRAECEAKRRIVAAAAKARDLMHQGAVDYAIAYEWVVKIYAATYADHPDYREEWKP